MKDFSSSANEEFELEPTDQATTMAKVLRRIARSVEERDDIAFNLRWEAGVAREEGRHRESQLCEAAAELVENGCS